MEKSINDLDVSLQNRVEKVTETIRNEMKAQISQSEKKIEADSKQR